LKVLGHGTRKPRNSWNLPITALTFKIFSANFLRRRNPLYGGGEFTQVERLIIFRFAHAAGVNSLIWVILAAGRRVNKSFK
jgi:hypothetical protein